MALTSRPIRRRHVMGLVTGAALLTAAAVTVPLAAGAAGTRNAAAALRVGDTRAATGAPDYVVYDDAPENGFADWSTGTHSIATTAHVHSGSAAIALTPAPGSGLQLGRSVPFPATSFSAVSLWVDGGTASGQKLTIGLIGGPTGVSLGAYLPSRGVVAGTWQHAVVPLDDLHAAGASIRGLWVQDASGGTQPTVYLDDVTLIPSPAVRTR